MKRELIPDIIKGIAIILVVVGHADSPFTKFLFYFHISIFSWFQEFSSLKNIMKAQSPFSNTLFPR